MNKAQSSDAWKKAVDFHGHVCPGLAIGFKAATAGMEWLKQNRSEDEELVAIVETNACSADAVQVITGCTFGKGNFIYKDYGKNVFSLVSRLSGNGVRVALRAGAFQPNERHMELIQKIRTDTATEQERSEFRSLHEQRSLAILERDPMELFTIESVTVELPPKATIEPSVSCAQCQEPTMQSRLEQKDGVLVCKTCSGAM
ncbi:FmdE family protein [Desulfomonile tiedjei]|uniref:Formylmethanofuran dehydrogenase subunit E n=1 Tax=Desulfomonile tiedjei (strain ATCC 49306 / DSM 6799 / DCB-1) TaxID=706587 RepID=I4C5R1_DESTA|nr:FmdE family protein [Desulfomonile tiedjei]AFM24902.1 formylmethanofuran dehydrogenase subunit E [Desulfomonile tiedjei DSM 6799]